MPKHITFRERPQARGWNARFRLERERGRRRLLRHARLRVLPEDRPWWWRIANR